MAIGSRATRAAANGSSAARRRRMRRYRDTPALNHACPGVFLTPGSAAPHTVPRRSGPGSGTRRVPALLCHQERATPPRAGSLVMAEQSMAARRVGGRRQPDGAGSGRRSAASTRAVTASRADAAARSSPAGGAWRRRAGARGRRAPRPGRRRRTRSACERGTRRSARRRPPYAAARRRARAGPPARRGSPPGAARRRSASARPRGGRRRRAGPPRRRRRAAGRRGDGTRRRRRRRRTTSHATRPTASASTTARATSRTACPVSPRREPVERRRVGEGGAGGRVGGHPADAGEPDLDPGVGVGLADEPGRAVRHRRVDARVGRRRRAAAGEPDREPGRDPHLAQQHDLGRRVLLAEPLPRPEEEVVDGVLVLAGHRGVEGVAGRRAQVVLDGADGGVPGAGTGGEARREGRGPRR